MTSSTSDARRLVFPGKQQVIIESFDPGLPVDGQVRVRTRLSLMSTGTENIVFNRLFRRGHPLGSLGQISVPSRLYVRWNRRGRRRQGRFPEDRGSRRFRETHRSHAVIKAADCFPIPDNIPDEHAVWFSLAKITFVGARAADYQLGDSALIIGAGPIGQMSLRWARAAGVSSLLVVDPAAHRMPLAEAGGATGLITASIVEAREAILQAGNGKLPRVVIDSTGNAAVFSTALELAADRDKVVILGDTGQPARQALTSDVITRGLTIVGAHDCHDTPEWHNATITQLFFNLAASGRFPLDGLTSHVFKPEQCAEAYATANRDRAMTMGILFDWATTGSK